MRREDEVKFLEQMLSELVIEVVIWRFGRVSSVSEFQMLAEHVLSEAFREVLKDSEV